MGAALRHLHPGPSRPTSLAEAYAGPLGSHPDRPWVGLCMVTSMDGSTVIDGASAGLSSENDSGVLLGLRTVADVILVGSGTAAGEGYGPPKTPGQRIAVVTRSGRVDTSTELFASGAGFVVTTEQTPLADPDVDVIRAGTDEVDLVAAIRQIPDLVAGASFVQAEGGPTLNGALADADLLDEINVNTSPALVGGSGPRLLAGAGDLAHRFSLEQLLIDDEAFVFSRWKRRRTSP